jgi:hypothetical protein
MLGMPSLAQRRQDAPREGVRRVLEHVLGKTFPRKERLPTNAICPS